jgi:hypothetical protein
MTRDPKLILQEQWLVALTLCEMLTKGEDKSLQMDVARRVCWQLRDEAEKAIRQLTAAAAGGVQ